MRKIRLTCVWLRWAATSAFWVLTRTVALLCTPLRPVCLQHRQALLRLPYLKDTKPREIETPEGKVIKSFKFSPGPHRNFIGLDRVFRESGKMKIHRIGNSVVRLLKGRDMIDIGVELGRRDPAFVLCDNPNCADCVRQRADIRRDVLKKESFRLVAAASLAGRYIPEMVENCQATGIDNVELDAVQGKPVQLIGGRILAAHVEELRSQGITVTALRPSAVTARLEDLFQIAAETNVKRVVLGWHGGTAPTYVRSRRADKDGRGEGSDSLLLQYDSKVNPKGF